MTQQSPEPRPDAAAVAAELMDRVVVPGIEVLLRLAAEVAIIVAVGRYMRWW